ncbi:MAG: Gfo/Idh/MocA family oxidoreductase [Acidobacteria bacterium]|nr:Gfo/Idh/MocA family oxidoreductase [Acidobacteriota bacterium]
MAQGDDHSSTERQLISRRDLLGTAGGGLMMAMLGNVWPVKAAGIDRPSIRWGIVGTGAIANSMATVIKKVPSGELTAVSSRRMESARGFASKYGAERAFDDWAKMMAWDGIDAVYVATPTGVREKISVAAANLGKHVLAEKPFASLPSLERIIAACRAGNVGFMDGTHFGHHPRTSAIRDAMSEQVGWPWSLTSTFQFSLPDRGNIRYNLDLEPMGAVGDVGWYCMRAITEYLPPDIEVRALETYLRRDPETGAAIAGSGVLQFGDGATSTWNCGFDAGGVCVDLSLTGARGVITVDGFTSNNADGPADYQLHRGGWGTTKAKTIRVDSEYTSPELMFEDFAAMTVDTGLRDRSIDDSLRTQRLLDRVWKNGLENEGAV